MKLPKSYDIIGDILIFEIKDKLTNKEEKQIANELLKLNSNIKVVAKRADIYKGKYRTRKIKILAGEKRTETIHKENGINIKLDVEKCYFSPRLSQERLRIARLVKENEDVLVMFSGVAPYPLVIAKNARPGSIYGIEINPVAYKYALENVRINRFSNIHLLRGDVDKELIYNENIGLKCAWTQEQLRNILKQKPKLIELHLFDDDLENNKEKIEQVISDLENKNIKVMIHCPIKYKNRYLEFSGRDFNYAKTIYNALNEICENHSNVLGFVAHVDSPNCKIGQLIKNLYTLRNIYYNMYVENSVWRGFSDPKDILEIIKNRN